MAYTAQELSILLAKKDQHCAGCLYDAYSAALYGAIVEIFPDREMADKVLEDAFVQIWRGLAGYDASKGSFFAWMLRTTRKTAIAVAGSLRQNGQMGGA